MIDLGKEDPKIAFVKLGSIGDCLQALPLVGAIRAKFPKAYLAWVVEEKSKDVLMHQKGIDKVIVINTREWRRMFKSGKIFSLMQELKSFRRSLSDLQFDLAIDAQGLIKSGLITYFTKAPIRIGFSRRFCREGINTLFTNLKIDPSGGHVVEHYLSLLSKVRGLNGTEKDHKMLTQYPLGLSASVKEKVSKLFVELKLNKQDCLIALHPGAGFETKRWPMNKFLDLAGLLMEKENVKVLITPVETSDLLDKLLPLRKLKPIVVPPLALMELAALYHECRVVVAGDTGPLHLAGAVGCPTVGLFGPSEAKRSKPFGPENAVVERSCSCRGSSSFFPRHCSSLEWCLGQIEVEEVYAQVKNLMVLEYSKPNH